MLNRVRRYFFNFINLSNILLIIMFLMIIGTANVLYYSADLLNINQQLGNISNIISIGSFLFSILAAVIALFAYKYSIQKPILNLRISQYLGNNKEFKMPLFHDKNGYLRISAARPLTEFVITIENNGNSSARYPVVFVQIDKMFFSKDAFPGWSAVLHAHGQGYYAYKWTPEDAIIYSGIPVKAPTLYLSGKRLPYQLNLQDKNEILTNIRLKFTADKTKVKELTVPIKLYVNDPV